jgi:integrase
MSRGNITRRGKSSWRIKIERKGEVPGKPDVYTETVKGRRQDAEKRLTELLGQIDAGTLVERTKVTVAEHVRAWVEAAEVQPKTRERYRQLCEQQIVPHLGNTELQKLKPKAIDDWHDTLLKKGGKDGTPLSARTVGHAHRLLHAAIKKAVKNEVLARNVVAVHAPPKVEDEEIEILDAEQVPVLLEAIAGHALGPIGSTGLATGCRRGELLALAWPCLDLDGAKVTIERSLEQTRDKETKKTVLRFKAPKTKSGHRTISLPASAVAALRKHRQAQLELRMQLGLGKLPDDALVFCRFDGGPIPPNDLSRDWARTSKRLGWPQVSFHGLRHTHASALIASGMDVVAISKRLGHKSPTTTLRIYAHLFARLATDAAAADAIEAVMRGGATKA